MIAVNVSLPTALAWVGVFLTLLGLASTGVGYLVNRDANKKLTELSAATHDMNRAINDLQGAALRQLLQQQERYVSHSLGDSDTAAQIETNINGPQVRTDASDVSDSQRCD